MVQDLTGQKFNHLKVIERGENRVNSKGHITIRWWCECDCGNPNRVLVDAPHLKDGHTKSCGCLLEKRKVTNKNPIVNNQKYCSICHRKLDIKDFYKSKSSSDGYSNYCKDCNSKPVKARFVQYQYGALSRNLEFNLTLDDFISITKQPCYYCNTYYDEYLNEPFNGVDRIDSSKGYSLNNCVPCCKLCNQMKMDSTEEEFLKRVAKVYEHNRGRIIKE